MSISTLNKKHHEPHEKKIDENISGSKHAIMARQKHSAHITSINEQSNGERVEGRTNIPF
jgi:hypothetical protein